MSHTPGDAASYVQNHGLAKAAPIKKIVIASAFGTVVEWYDFFVYGTAAALVFGKLFFPASDPVVSTLAAFSVYAVGYVARPFGGIVIAHFGDRLGRRSMLVLSMLLMGFGTFLVGVLPTYEQIGILAPFLLVLLRLVQAIGLGGEWGGAALMVAENAPPLRRGLFGSLVQLGNPMGGLPRRVYLHSPPNCRSPNLHGVGAFPFLQARFWSSSVSSSATSSAKRRPFEKSRKERNIEKMPVLEAISKYRWETLVAIGLKVTEVAWVGIAVGFRSCLPDEAT